MSGNPGRKWCQENGTALRCRECAQLALFCVGLLVVVGFSQVPLYKLVGVYVNQPL